MTAAIADPKLALAGVPFLDGEFQHNRLVAAVCAVRHSRGLAAGRAKGITPANITTWLAPARAAMLSDDAPPLPAAPLPSAGLAEVEQALTLLAKEISSWSPLLKLPVRFAALRPPTGAISASMRSWPQHVLLANDAFASPAELAEQVLHEMAHQWMYLVMEVWPLTRGTEGLGPYTLPSGTGGKQLWEVIGAAHVAAVLRRWYRDGPYADLVRIEELRGYADGCLALLSATNLTPAGELFAARIKEVL